MKIIIINGPNLNLQGNRQPEVYGNRNFNEYLVELSAMFPQIQIEYFQSNHAGEIIDKIHEGAIFYDGIIINAASYTHTSIGMGDAIAAIKKPVVEVHISNIFAREQYRQFSYISRYAKAIVSGFGIDSYEYAVRGLLKLLEK